MMWALIYVYGFHSSYPQRTYSPSLVAIYGSESYCREEAKIYNEALRSSPNPAINGCHVECELVTKKVTKHPT
jgi:hypothetical protein